MVNLVRLCVISINAIPCLTATSLAFLQMWVLKNPMQTPLCRVIPNAPHAVILSERSARKESKNLIPICTQTGRDPSARNVVNLRFFTSFRQRTK